MAMEAKATKFGSNIDTDQIIPACFLNTSDPKELAKHAMGGAEPELLKVLEPTDIIVGESNFGCGSSREHAPICIKEAGHPCVIASSFARIFYRNALNIGLPIFESADAVNAIETGKVVSVDPDKGEITVDGKTFPVAPYPVELQDMISAGGLMPYVVSKLGK